MNTDAWIEAARAAYLDDAEAYLRTRGLIPEGETRESLAGHWREYIRQYYDPARPAAFYASWQGTVGAANVFVNIADQFGRTYVVNALQPFFAAPYGFTGTILDFGCGTAAISLNWQWSFAPRATLLLADVENLPMEFVRHAIAQHPECRSLVHNVLLEGIPDHSVDLALCIDVLEHLPHPSETFALLHRKLRNSAILLLQAPWGGHPEHLPEAPIDWRDNGGAQLLREQYNQLAPMTPGTDPSGIYLKRLAG